MEMKKRSLTYIVLIITLLVDFITKIALTNKSIVLIKSFLSLIYTKNYGAAWSIFLNQRLLLILISIVLLIIIFSYSLKFKINKKNLIAFGLLLGGLLGNLIDRIIYGYVRDFISLQFGNYYYPIFNVADMAIVVGVIIIAIAIIKKEDNNGKN